MRVRVCFYPVRFSRHHLDDSTHETTRGIRTHESLILAELRLGGLSHSGPQQSAEQGIRQLIVSWTPAKSPRRLRNGFLPPGLPAQQLNKEVAAVQPSFTEILPSVLQEVLIGNGLQKVASVQGKRASSFTYAWLAVSKGAAARLFIMVDWA